MSWRSDWPSPDLLASRAPLDERRRPAARHPGGEALASRLRHLRAQIRRAEPPRRPPNPVLIEEEAMAHLYGARTGTVSPSTTRAPVSSRAGGEHAPVPGGPRTAGSGAARRAARAQSP